MYHRRMDNEDLNPTVLALEALEKVIEELKSQERGQSMLQVSQGTEDATSWTIHKSASILAFH